MIRRTLRRTASQVAASLDRAVTTAAAVRMRNRRKQSRAESLSPEERLEALAALFPFYNRPEFFTDPNTFFPAADEVTPKRKRVRQLRGGQGVVLDLSWPSAYTPFADEVAERYLRHKNNLRSAARLFLHRDRPRPVIVLIHGYLGGRFSIEERVWPISWFFDQGLDVALAVLPHHGVRSDKGGWPKFPSSDPRLTIEGFRQAVFDLRTLRFLLEGRGAPSVGVAGMSLGGYTASLWATVEPQLSFAMPMIPLASIADFARAGGRFTGTPTQARAQHEALERLMRPVSPLARPSAIDRERILVLAAEGDRITPPDHARRLADHFQAPLETFAGGHLLQLGRGEAFRRMRRLMVDVGVIPRRR